jgi:VCBS repeat-containing protein
VESRARLDVISRQDFVPSLAACQHGQILFGCRCFYFFHVKELEKMLDFSWNQWLNVVSQVTGMKKVRKPRLARTEKIEHLEDRALLTANLPIAVSDVYNVNENTSLNATSVLINDTDADGDTISQATLQSTVAHGTLTLAGDGTFTYVPANNFTGTDSFTYFAVDAAHAESSLIAGKVTIHVGEPNTAPVATAATINATTDTAFHGTLAGTDAEGDPLTFSAGTAAAVNGSVVINSDGTYTFTPTAGVTGAGSFSFKANDGTVNSPDATVSVNIAAAGANVLPVVSNTSFVTTQNTAVHGKLSASDSNGDPLTFATGAAAATGGSVVVNSDGSFTFTPTAGFSGPATFSFKANDGIGNSTDATATVNVLAGVNIAPIGTAATISTATGTAVSGTLAATDANGDTLTFAAGTTAAAHGTVTINPNGTFTYTPNAGFTGTDSFSFKASDGTLTSANTVETVHVGITNSLPVVAPITLSTPSNTALNGTLTATDANVDPLTFSAGTAAATGGTVVVNPNGTFTFTPTAGFSGPATFSFKANDGIGNSTDATATVNVAASVNVAPIGTAATISTATGTAFSGTLAATDANGDTLTYAAGTTAAAHGTVTINPNGTFTYTPTAGFTGTDSFSFIASDGDLFSANTVETVHVGVANSLPVVAPITLASTTNTVVTGTLTATDANGDPLTFSAGSTAATGGTVVISPNGNFTFTPTAGFTGPATFSFKANDGIGNSADATTTINISASVNVAPIGTAATISTATGTAFTGTLAATDANGDTLTFAAGTTAAAHGTVTINPNGTFTYTPNAGFTGTDSFSFKASDGTLTSANTIETVHVGVTNSLPVVTPVTLSTPLNTALTGTLTATDANGDPLTFSAGTAAATGGTVVINPNGSFTFTPTIGFTGPATFSFKANDGIGNSTDAIASVNVGAVVNVAPVVLNGVGTTNFGTALAGTLTALASDINGDALTFSAVTQPAHGTLTVNSDGTYSYSPNAGFSGADSFTFKANDGTLDSNVGTFNITVSASTSPITLSLATNGTIATRLRSVTALDANAALINVDPSVSFANATITASITAGGDSRHDKLLVTKVRGSNVVVRGKKILIDGTQVATISGGTHGQQLQVTFTSSASQATVTSVLDRIGAKTTRSSSGDVRTVQLTVNAGIASSTGTILATKVTA